MSRIRVLALIAAASSMLLVGGCKSRPFVDAAQMYLDAVGAGDFAKAYGMLDEETQQAITQPDFEEDVKKNLQAKVPNVRIKKFIKEKTESGQRCTIETEFTGDMKSHNANVSARVTIELVFERGQWRVHLPDAIAAWAEKEAAKAEAEALKQLVAEWKGRLDFTDIKIQRYTPTPEEVEFWKAKSPRMKIRDKKDEQYEEVGEDEEKEIPWLKIPWWSLSGTVFNRGDKVVNQAGVYFKFYNKDDPRKKLLYDSTIYTVYYQYDDDPKYNKDVLLPSHEQKFMEVIDLVDLPEDWTMDQGVLDWELIDIRVDEPNPEQLEKIEKMKKKLEKKGKKRR